MNELAKTFLDLRPLTVVAFSAHKFFCGGIASAPWVRLPNVNKVRESGHSVGAHGAGVITSLYELVMRVWRKAVVGLSPRRER